MTTIERNNVMSVKTKPTINPERLLKKPVMKAPIYTQPQPAHSQPVGYDFSKRHIHIMIPCYGGMMSEATTTSLIRFLMVCQQVKLGWSIDTMTNESLIPRGRNNLCAKAMCNTNMTDMLFIDADIRFQPEHILGMIVADKDVIGGLYPKKALPIDYVVNIKRGGRCEGPLFEVDTLGTGFLMFKRSVYEKLCVEYADQKYIDDVGIGKEYEKWMYNIFDVVIDTNGHMLSEDWTFCRRWAELNGEIWADSRILLNHLGTYEFHGDREALERKGLKVVDTSTPEGQAFIAQMEKNKQEANANVSN